MTDESKREAATSDSTERQAFEALEWDYPPIVVSALAAIAPGGSIDPKLQEYFYQCIYKGWQLARASSPSQAEPVAWRWRLLPYLAQPNRRVRNDWILCSSAAECPENVAPTESWDGSEVQPLYTHPTASSQPPQEPVATVVKMMRPDKTHVIKALLHTHNEDGSERDLTPLIRQPLYTHPTASSPDAMAALRELVACDAEWSRLEVGIPDEVRKRLRAAWAAAIALVDKEPAA